MESNINSINSNNFNQARNFLEINGLNDIRQQSKSENSEDKQAALKEAAQQFESIFMQMLLKSMRSAQDVLESDSPFNSESTKFYRDMHDQQMAVELSSNGTLGLSDLIVRQLGGDDTFTPRTVLRSDGNLPKSHKSSTDDLNTVNSSAHVPFKVEKSVKISSPTFQEPKDFVTALIEPAQAVQKELGVPFEVVIAQSALETGWGQKIIKDKEGTSSNNLFNIKADSRWSGDKVNKETLEFEQGSMVKTSASFRVYESLKDSANDYINFLSSNERYNDALKNPENVEQFLLGLQSAGYATDPNYADKILSTLRTVTNLITK